MRDDHLFDADTICSEITESLEESRRPPLPRDDPPLPRPLILQSPRTPRSLCIKPRPARDASYSPPRPGAPAAPAWLLTDGVCDSPAMPAPNAVGGGKAVVERERPMPPPPPEPPKSLDSIVVAHLREQVGLLLLWFAARFILIKCLIRLQMSNL